MTTDSGLVYLSGLLRAGAEPLSPAARAERRRAARPTHASRASGDLEDDDAGQSAYAAPGHAGEGDARTGVADAEHAEESVAVKSSAATGDRHTPFPDVPPVENTVESFPDDVAEVVEQHLHAQMQSRAMPPSSRGVRATPGTNSESHTPAASPTAPVAGEARTRPADERRGPGLRADEIRGGETEQTPTEAGEGELIPATCGPLDVRPTATLHEEPNDSAVTQSETFSTVEGSPRRKSKAKTADEVSEKKAKTADEVLKTANDESAAHDASSVLPGASFLLPGASSARGSSARRDPPARVSRASREEGSPTFAGDRAHSSEGGAEPADASAGTSADSAPFTLEAHVEHLRALMRTARAEAPDEEDETGAARPRAIIASHHTPPLTTAARPAREQPRTEFEARPETPTTASKSVERQSVALVNQVERQPAVPVNQEPTGASSGRETFATEARPATPRAAWARPGGVSPARARGEETTPAQPAQSIESAHVTTADAPSAAQDSAPTIATTLARVGPAPAREGGSTGPTATTGGGRAPAKLTINRLDVQVVRPHEPPPEPPEPEPSASESPPRAADPWGALDRQLLGRFSY